jgi:isoleucyl-tRNA synthetase
MDIAQKISSMVLGLRRKVNIKVRQPLNRLMLPVLNKEFKDQFGKIKNLVLNEVNVKMVEYLEDTTGILVKNIKPNFKTLGPKFGKQMKQVAAIINGMGQPDISRFEKEGFVMVDIDGKEQRIGLEDVEILNQDIPGWLVATEGRLTVALDVTITEALRFEGIAREFVNRIQNLRKESGLEVTDKINLFIGQHNELNDAVNAHKQYIAAQTLANNIELVRGDSLSDASVVEIENGIETVIKIVKHL